MVTHCRHWLTLCSQRVSLELPSQLSGIRGNPRHQIRIEFSQLNSPSKPTSESTFDATAHVNVLPSLPHWVNLNLKKGKKKKKKVQSFVSTSLNKCAQWFRWKGDNTQHVWQAVFVRVFFLYLTARWRDYTVISSVHPLTLHHRFSSECLHSSHSLIRPRVVKKRKKKEKENCPPAKPLPTVHVMPSSALFKKKKNWLYALEPQVQGLKANISKIFPQQSLRRLH